MPPKKISCVSNNLINMVITKNDILKILRAVTNPGSFTKRLYTQ